MNYEVLYCNGDDIDACISILQQIVGNAADRLSVDKKTGKVTFDTQGLNLNKNEGAAVINDLVSSKSVYGFAVSATVDTAAGDHLPVDGTANLPPAKDQPQAPNELAQTRIKSGWPNN